MKKILAFVASVVLALSVCIGAIGLSACKKKKKAVVEPQGGITAAECVGSYKFSSVIMDDSGYHYEGDIGDTEYPGLLTLNSDGTITSNYIDYLTYKQVRNDKMSFADYMVNSRGKTDFAIEVENFKWRLENEKIVVSYGDIVAYYHEEVYDGTYDENDVWETRSHQEYEKATNAIAEHLTHLSMMELSFSDKDTIVGVYTGADCVYTLYATRITPIAESDFVGQWTATKIEEFNIDYNSNSFYGEVTSTETPAAGEKYVTINEDGTCSGNTTCAYTYWVYAGDTIFASKNGYSNINFIIRLKNDKLIITELYDYGDRAIREYTCERM